MNEPRCLFPGCGLAREAATHILGYRGNFHKFVSPSEPEVGPRKPIASGSGGTGYLIKQNCPLCGNHTIYEEAPEDNAPTKYYCHGCDKGFDSFEAVAPEPKPEPRECTTCGGPILTCCGKAESCCQCRM